MFVRNLGSGTISFIVLMFGLNVRVTVVPPVYFMTQARSHLQLPVLKITEGKLWSHSLATDVAQPEEGARPVLQYDWPLIRGESFVE